MLSKVVYAQFLPVNGVREGRRMILYPLFVLVFFPFISGFDDFQLTTCFSL